jgi:hypothetical protein
MLWALARHMTRHINGNLCCVFGPGDAVERWAIQMGVINEKDV